MMAPTAQYRRESSLKISKMKTLKLIFLLWIMALPSISQIISTKTNGIKLDMADATEASLPKVVWQNPLQDDVSTENNSINLVAQITSPDPIIRITVQMLNSALSKPFSKDIEIPEGATTFSLNQPFRLWDGVSTVEIIVTSNKGGIVKGSRTISVGKNNTC